MATEKIRQFNRLTKEWIDLDVIDNKISTGLNDSGTVKNFVIHNPLTKQDIQINVINDSIQIL